MAFIKHILLVIVSIVTFGLVHQPGAIPTPTVNPAPFVTQKTATPAPTSRRASPAPSSTPVPSAAPTNISAPTPTPNGTLCNGTYYTACPTGQDFICPATGKAYCQDGQLQTQKAQALASLTAQLQSYQNQYAQLHDTVVQLQNQYAIDCPNTPIEYQQGQGGVQQNYQLQVCLAKAQYIAGVAQELPQIQAQISDIRQRISIINNLPIQ